MNLQKIEFLFTNFLEILHFIIHDAIFKKKESISQFLKQRLRALKQDQVRRSLRHLLLHEVGSVSIISRKLQIINRNCIIMQALFRPSFSRIISTRDECSSRGLSRITRRVRRATRERDTSGNEVAAMDSRTYDRKAVNSPSRFN